MNMQPLVCTKIYTGKRDSSECIIALKKKLKYQKKCDN